MGITFNREEEVTNEILQKYVNGNLEIWIVPEVEKYINTSKKVFQRYMEIMEMQYYISKGSPISKRMEEKVLNMLPNADSKKSHLALRVSLQNDKVIIFSSDKEEVNFFSDKEEHAWNSSEPSSFSIKRYLSGEEVSIEIIPGEKKHNFQLAVESKPGMSIDCEIYDESKVIEYLQDVSSRKTFDYPIKSMTKTNLRFLRNSSIAFTISLSIRYRLS
ncbi:hypothetical protein [Leptospira sp. GIMC2001]|uniref:hypothetical protein n=1 Tax=Leptospira sp. GIMC2001 TaxID=1513297 RepID=UPI00234A123A|nr:hypothetical protein [Leptospira sp. GIMC2001]WCL50763.1 hypothetical protein O4O04_08105 [Leptospira sp. GIMC2001]